MVLYNLEDVRKNKDKEMKIYEVTDIRTDEVAPIFGGIGVGAALLYVASALGTAFTIKDYLDQSEIQGSYDPTEWDDDAKYTFFGEVAISTGLGIAGKTIGWGMKAVKGFKSAAKSTDDVKGLANKVGDVKPPAGSAEPTKATNLSKDIYGRIEPTLSMPGKPKSTPRKAKSTPTNDNM